MVFWKLFQISKINKKSFIGTENNYNFFFSCQNENKTPNSNYVTVFEFKNLTIFLDAGLFENWAVIYCREIGFNLIIVNKFKT